METVALLYEDYQKELAEDFKNTFLKRASDTDSSRSNDTVIDEVTDMLSTNIAVYTEKLLQRWGFSSGGEGGGGGDVTVTLDDLLKKYLSDNYVTIKGDQEVFGEKDFRKGIRIAGRRLYWDEGNDALVIEGAAYTTRWLSAKGVSPGGGGAGSGGAAAMYQLIDVSPNDTKDAVLGAEKDYVLTFDGSFWRGMPNKGGLSSKLFTALDKEGHEINPDDENAEIYAIRANYSLWSVGFLSAKGISDGGTGGGGGGAVALYQLLDVEKNADITGVAGATKGSVLTFNGDKWYADKPKTAAGISNLFTALDNDGNEVDLNDESKLGTITNIRANYALWSVDWISAKGKSSGGSGGGGGLINLVYGFESLGGTFDNNDNSATFNAFTINEIWKLASSGLTNVTVTGSGNAVTDVTKGSDGRSLTFTKGSTFATKSEFDALNTKFNDFLTGSDADDIINKWSELEVFLQGMKESDNLAVILQSKMDKTAFSKLFTALDASGNEVDPSDSTKTIASIRANFGFWGVDYISAKGVSKGSGGTGGASTLYQLVDVLANDTEDGVEGAAAGKALVFDGTHWRAGDAGLNESQLYSYLTANKYLTQSAADSRYVTSSRKVIAGTGLSGGGALTSDVTLSLGTSGVVAGTYTKVIVDAYGRVTSGTNLSATDIPNLDWSKITTGKPTTLAGYGITDAVTLTTAQTISGRKTFSQNIVFNNNGGITYTDSNVVLRNSDGHTILASFGNGEINLRPNGHNNTEGAVWINKAGNVQAPSVSTNTITIGDAQLVYDSKNKALRVKHRTDGNTVGFYSDGWITALGVQTGGAGGSGVIKTVYSFANLTDGTTFSDSDLNNTFNAYTIKEIWKMAKEGGGIKNIAQSGSGNAVTNMTLSSDGKTITAVFGKTFASQQDLGTLNNTVTQLSNKLNNFLEGLTENNTLIELLALKADKTITISAGTGLTGGGNLSANRTLSLATTGVKAGTYTKVTVDTYGRVTVGDNPTTLAGYGITGAYTKTEADGRYVKKAGDTMTGDLAMDTNKGFYFPRGTRVVKTSGNWIHDGGDTASSTDANLRFASWYGIGWYPTIDSTSGVRQGNNAMWLNVRTGVLDVHSNITSHNGYLAANWDSARRLVLGGGSSYAWIGSRNSSNNVLCNIVLQDNKVLIGNYAESSRFVSTVGTGTQPYQCNSTTLNTNLNADMLDNWHLNFLPRNYNIGRCYAVRFALGGKDNGWKKIFACSESGTGPYRSVTVWGRIWYAYGNHAQSEVFNYHFCAIFYMRSGPSSSNSSVGNVENSARLYLPTFAKGMDNIRLVRVGTNNFELQVRQISSYHNANIEYQYWSCGCNVSAWENLQSTSNTSVAVSAGGASTLADSRASSADVWTTARTFYIQDYHSANTGAGVSVNGGSNCYLKLPSTTRFSRIDFSTPNANIRHSGNDNGNEVGNSTLSNLVIDSWYGVSFTTTYSSTYQNKIAMSVNCRTGRVTANNFHAATNITANGAITAKASSSDIRLKTDIQGYDAMGIIRKFRSVKYHWNAIAKENSEVFNHDNWNYGLIAQDLLSGGYTQWVKDIFNDYYTIDYERLIPVVWKGLQEVDDEVTKLKKEVARLNKRVKELEKSLCA